MNSGALASFWMYYQQVASSVYKYVDSWKCPLKAQHRELSWTWCYATQIEKISANTVKKECLYQHNEIRVVELHKATSSFEVSLTRQRNPSWLNLSVTYNEQYSVCKAGISGCCRGSQLEQVDKSIYCCVKVSPDPVVQRKKKRKENPCKEVPLPCREREIKRRH